VDVTSLQDKRHRAVNLTVQDASAHTISSQLGMTAIHFINE
jgi:hypothetical protein